MKLFHKQGVTLSIANRISVMSLKTTTRKKTLSSKFEEIYIPVNSAGLARSHKIIRIEHEKELQFMKICSQIRLDDFREKRSDNQRVERRLKRRNSYTSTITE